jgi:hypothetical protein
MNILNFAATTAIQACARRSAPRPSVQKNTPHRRSKRAAGFQPNISRQELALVVRRLQIVILERGPADRRILDLPSHASDDVPGCNQDSSARGTRLRMTLVVRRITSRPIQSASLPLPPHHQPSRGRQEQRQQGRFGHRLNRGQRSSGAVIGLPRCQIARAEGRGRPPALPD